MWTIKCLALFVAPMRKHNREVTVMPVKTAAVKVGVLSPMKGGSMLLGACLLVIAQRTCKTFVHGHGCKALGCLFGCCGGSNDG